MSIRSYQGHRPLIDSSAYIDKAAVIIGNVVIGKECSIWPMAVIRGDVNAIRIGDYSNIQDGSVLHVTHPHSAVPDGYPLIIGNEVTGGGTTSRCTAARSRTVASSAWVQPCSMGW